MTNKGPFTAGDVEQLLVSLASLVDAVRAIPDPPNLMGIERALIGMTRGATPMVALPVDGRGASFRMRVRRDDVVQIIEGSDGVTRLALRGVPELYDIPMSADDLERALFPEWARVHYAPAGSWGPVCGRALGDGYAVGRNPERIGCPDCARVWAERGEASR